MKGESSTRPMTTCLFQLRALELGIRKQDLRLYSCGEIFGILAEKSNDRFKWPRLATQKDIETLFPR